MKVNLYTIITSEEVIFYVDAKRFILLYGLHDDAPSSLRVLWLTTNGDRSITTLNSYDEIGGYPGMSWMT